MLYLMNCVMLCVSVYIKYYDGRSFLPSVKNTCCVKLSLESDAHLHHKILVSQKKCICHYQIKHCIMLEGNHLISMSTEHEDLVVLTTDRDLHYCE